MQKVMLIGFMILGFAFTGSAQADEWVDRQAEAYKKAKVEHAEKADKVKAFKATKKMAMTGNPFAQYFLAEMYAKGDGTPQNTDAAETWFLKAADNKQIIPDLLNDIGVAFGKGRLVIQDYDRALNMYKKASERGCIIADYNIGIYYLKGFGVPKNEKLAFDYFNKSSAFADSQNEIGYMYTSGSGVAQNDKLAMQWFLKAAEQNNTYAQNNIGVLYQHGRGVEKNPTKAMEWYKKSAELGNTKAMYNIAMLYLNGEGVEADAEQAKTWLVNAGRLGDKKATEKLKSLGFKPGFWSGEWK